MEAVVVVVVVNKSEELLKGRDLQKYPLRARTGNQTVSSRTEDWDGEKDLNRPSEPSLFFRHEGSFDDHGRITGSLPSEVSRVSRKKREWYCDADRYYYVTENLSK